MSIMKRQSQSSVVAIEWSSTAAGDPSDSVALRVDDLVALASALGRLAAKRDLARDAAEPLPQDIISDPIGDKVKAPV